jgi:hypothetical protein
MCALEFLSACGGAAGGASLEERKEVTLNRQLAEMRNHFLATLALAAALTPAACGKEQPGAKEENVMTFAMTSLAFKQSERIPKQYTGEGADLSPPLEWAEPPAATKAFALICDDPDAPVGTWDHWVIWNIPAALRKLPEGIARTEKPADPAGAVQGKNSWPKDNIGYRGPMPPPGHGTHRYNFVLYALDAPLDLKAGANKKELLAAMKGHILGQAKLTGTYSR